MRKYMLRYLIFWLPAVLVAYFYTNTQPVSYVLQWFTAFFMLFGWSANTGMSAYHFPRATLSALLCYAGFHILIIVTMYAKGSESSLGGLLWEFGGILSFKPLGIFIRSFKPLRVPWPWEMLILGGQLACLTTGYLIGVIQRKVNPNPYSPRIQRG